MAKELYHEEHGDGPALLGIHGTPSCAVLWEDAAARLAGTGRCVIYDRRGFHRSASAEPPKRLDLDDHVADAAALLDALSAGPAALIGRSTGGVIALEFARRFPDRVTALVLLEPALFTLDEEAAAWAAGLRRAVLAAEPADAARTVLDEALGAGAWESFPGEVRELFAGMSPAVLAEIAGSGLDLSDEPLDLDAGELAAIGAPTLVVASEESPEAFRRVCDRLTEGLPRAEESVVPGGHVIDPAHPDVLRFLAAAVG